MVERIRNEFRRITTGKVDGERMSQAELDAYRRQLIMAAVTVAAIALILILGIGAYYQYIHLPRQTVAAVNDDTINRDDYWEYRRYELLNQINQYQQFAQMMEGEQSEQYVQLAQEANQEFEDVENASIDPRTVDEMITDKILMDALDEFGLEITEEEIDDRLVEFFTGTSISDEDPGPSADPTAEAWATATAEAQQEEQEEQEEEAEADAEDGDSSENDSENETDDASENSDENENETDEDENPFDDAADDEEDAGTPEPEPTPGDEEIRLTAEANQEDHEEFLLDRAGISHDEFVEMFILPEIAQEKIQAHLAEDVPTRGEQVEAAHILVATEDASQIVYEDLTEDDADFADLAEQQSTDESTAPNGGELGWFPRGIMVDEFDEVVFDMEVGEISEPFQTDFGWHVVTVLDRDDDRPINLQTLQQLRQQAFDDWLEEQREAADIETDHELPEDSTQQPQQFQPPAGAPQPPQPDMDMQQDIQIDGGDVQDEQDDPADGDDEGDGDDEN